MEEVGMTLIRIEAILSSLVHKVDELDRRVDKLDQRFDTLDRHVDKLGQRFDTLDRRVDKLEMRGEKQFLWLAGVQMTTLITIVAGLFGLVAKLM